MRDWTAVIAAMLAGIIGVLLGAVLMVIAPDHLKRTIEHAGDTVRSQAQLALHRSAPTALVPLAPPTSSPPPTSSTSRCFALPHHRDRTPVARSESDEQRWRIAEIRCRSQPPITGRDAFRLLNVARRLAVADDEGDRCWSLALALPGGEDYLAEAPHALMSGDTDWSEVYRKRFDAHDLERQQLQDQADALIRELCRAHYNESECVSFTDDETGEQHLCPLSLGNPDSTNSRQ